ncbi:MAG: LacI family DNA-binding transcriptional regulator [Spirochaetes bacterium]|nr:LacI family DNA-binding transcriptional regulator [Spirochaetota bacterium]
MEILITEIGGKAPGDPLPSIRDLIRRTGLSHQTVVRAMEALEREGYVDLQVGKGAFVAHREKTLRPAHPSRCPHGTVIFALPEFESHWAWSLLHLAEVQAVRGGHGLVTFRLDPGSTWEELRAYMSEEKSLRGALVLPPASLFNENDQAFLDSLPVPVVSLLPLLRTWPNLRSVSGEAEQTGRLMAEALLDKGHRRLAFLRHQPSIEVQRGWERGMRQALDARGLDASALRLWGEVIPDWKDSMAEAQRLTEAQIQRGLEGVTGILYSTSLGALAGSRALLAAGFQIPEDLSVIGSTHHPLLSYTTPTIAHTRGDWEAAMPVAFSMIRGEDASRHFWVESRLVAGESLGAAPSAR